jgi:hypothetical protein
MKEKVLTVIVTERDPDPDSVFTVSSAEKGDNPVTAILGISISESDVVMLDGKQFAERVLYPSFIPMKNHLQDVFRATKGT